MTDITCRLTAKNRDQLRSPRLCNRVWATFTFYQITAVRRIDFSKIENASVIEIVSRLQRYGESRFAVFLNNGRPPTWIFKI